jgi:hypothetical protein
MTHGWTVVKPCVQQHEEDFYCLQLARVDEQQRTFILILRCLDDLNKIKIYDRIGIVTIDHCWDKKRYLEFPALFRGIQHETIRIV